MKTLITAAIVAILIGISVSIYVFVIKALIAAFGTTWLIWMTIVALAFVAGLIVGKGSETWRPKKDIFEGLGV